MSRLVEQHYLELDAAREQLATDSELMGRLLSERRNRQCSNRSTQSVPLPLFEVGCENTCVPDAG